MNTNTNTSKSHTLITMLKRFRLQRGTAWGIIIIGALLAFEAFNYSTTQFALNDVLGDLKFAGLRWATILALAFCGIDFAGIARLFTPEQGHDEPAEVWYLFGAWLLAAAMNAALTWWGVAVAISSHASLSSGVIGSNTLTRVVPVFVAIMVWLIRVLIIGTFSVKGGKLFSQSDTRTRSTQRPVYQSAVSPAAVMPAVQPHPAPVAAFRPAARAARPGLGYNRPEPTYRNLSIQSKPAREAEYTEAPRNA